MIVFVLHLTFQHMMMSMFIEECKMYENQKLYKSISASENLKNVEKARNTVIIYNINKSDDPETLK